MTTLHEAMQQALDDMGKDGHSVCPATKQVMQQALRSALEAPKPMVQGGSTEYNALKRVAYKYNLERSRLRQLLSSLGRSEDCRKIHAEIISEIDQGSSAVEPRKCESVVGSIPTSDLDEREALIAKYPSCGPASTLDNETLIEVALSVYARSAHYGTEVLHNRSVECNMELLKRLKAADMLAADAHASTDINRYTQATLAGQAHGIELGLAMAADASKESGDLHIAYMDGYAQGKADAVKPGYVLVPLEPTPEMLVAGETVMHNFDWVVFDKSVYKAMLAAAPQGEA